MLALATIIVVTFCGLSGTPMWTIPAATIALASVSYARHQMLFRRAADLGMQEAIDQTLVASLLNAFIACSAAYAMGAALRFLALGS